MTVPVRNPIRISEFAGKPKTGTIGRGVSHMHRPISSRRAAFHILGVVLLIAVSLAVLLKIGARTGVLGRSTELTVRFGRVDGLRTGDQVRLQGLRIGSVSRIDPPAKAGEDLVVRLKVDPSIARILRSDCSATIAFQGMIGQPVVELAAGSADARAAQNSSRASAAIREPIEVRHGPPRIPSTTIRNPARRS